jgi:hypothetical protein
MELEIMLSNIRQAPKVYIMYFHSHKESKPKVMVITIETGNECKMGTV